MTNSRKNRGSNPLLQGLLAGALTFAIALLFSLPSQTLVRELDLAIALPTLVVIILIGVIFDIIGVAVAAADEAPFHSMATKRVSGSRQAVVLIRNADRVASFCNDVVGDVAGTLSGALGAAIVFRIVSGTPLNKALLDMIMVAMVAALSVGGKAAGKGLAIRQANSIILKVGRIIQWSEGVLGVKLLSERGNKRGRGERRR